MAQPGPGTYNGLPKLVVTGKQKMDDVVATAMKQIERHVNGLFPINPTNGQVLSATGKKAPQALQWATSGAAIAPNWFQLVGSAITFTSGSSANLAGTGWTTAATMGSAHATNNTTFFTLDYPTNGVAVFMLQVTIVPSGTLTAGRLLCTFVTLGPGPGTGLPPNSGGGGPGNTGPLFDAFNAKQVGIASAPFFFAPYQAGNGQVQLSGFPQFSGGTFTATTTLDIVRIL